MQSYIRTKTMMRFNPYQNGQVTDTCDDRIEAKWRSVAATMLRAPKCLNCNKAALRKHVQGAQ